MRYGQEGKAALFAEWEDRLIIMDTLIVCRFYRDLYPWEELSTLIQAATGLDLNVEEMRCIARKISSATRRFNIQEGLKPEGDKLPQRFHTEILPETQKVITEEQMDRLLTDYYRVRGWDEEGTPPET
jgi:aldehyde:ferredoxin oxidoreductase